MKWKSVIDKFDSFKGQAQTLLKNADQTKLKLSEVKQKMESASHKHPKVQSFLDQMETLMQMVKSYITGEYRIIPWKTLVFVVAGMLYFLNPADVVPDFIPTLGLIDDITLMVWIYRQAISEIEKYKAWRETRIINIQELPG